MANPNLTKGNNYFRNEQYKEAIEACSKIDKSSTSYPYALFNIGECYFQQGKFIEAIKYYSQISNNHFSLYKTYAMLLQIHCKPLTARDVFIVQLLIISHSLGVCCQT